ncbi:MAG: hypothetical protein ACR2KB_12230 [Chitinophagaceae bacterium]|nr:hypothetical protein [Flavisolibacter sp.]
MPDKKYKKEAENKASEKEKLPKDYWDRVAEDAASGYGADEDGDTNLLNEDQQPDDHEKG